MQNSFTMIILGATGDLSVRKLLPAVYQLLKDAAIDRCAVVGIGLEPVDGLAILNRVRALIPAVDPVIWQKLEQMFYYVAGDVSRPETYAQLGALLAEVEQHHQCGGNRLFYFATMPEHFAVITSQLAQHRIALHTRDLTDSTWCRVVYEKPFGVDGFSAQQINTAIGVAFDETQVFRIDHYLGKELVGNIATLRFANTLFEPVWRAAYIEQVQIIVNEADGIAGRGAYYDAHGALRDMVQSHLMQLLALVAMEQPASLCGDDVRAAKAAVIATARVEDILYGQYDGYTQEPFVRADSSTETFVALKIAIDNERWCGVPFFLKTGKRVHERHASIQVVFKGAAGCAQNVVTIHIEPDEGFVVRLNAKVPGSTQQVTPITMHWSHQSVFGHNTPKSYERLLVDVIRGDQTVFVRFDEIAYSWQLLERYHHKKVVYLYARGSRGPQELELFEATHKMRWQR